MLVVPFALFVQGVSNFGFDLLFAEEMLRAAVSGPAFAVGVAEKCQPLRQLYRQEYECSFEMMAGAVYPQWSLALRPGLAREVAASFQLADAGQVGNLPPQTPRLSPVADPFAAIKVWQSQEGASRPPPLVPRWGGIDFGFRNPFAAIWGHLQPPDTLCITGERYGSGLTVEEHARHLPKSVMWFCDPSGAGEIRRLGLMNFKALGADNALREGIAAVSGRIQSGRLLIDPDTCPNLATEGGLYAYDPDGELVTETPIDRDNHALSALRYLVMGLAKRCPKPVTASNAPRTAPLRSLDDMVHDEHLWTSL